jgi:electron transport complex protein RnfD
MEFVRRDAPFLAPKTDVPSIMRQVLYALVPATIAHVWFFGPGLILNMMIAMLFCIGGEAAMMRARGKPVGVALGDYSAVVTAVILAFALPPLTPWWVTATAALFGIVVAKQLYGGLGFNIFNPAMAGYVAVLVAFPTHLNFWTVPRIGILDYHYVTLLETLRYTLTGSLPDYLTIDAVSRPSPLDAVKAGLSTMHTFAEIHKNPMMGNFGGRGWEWISNFILLGGIWLLMKRIIRWQIPLGVFAGLLVPTTIMYAIESGNHASPDFYLFSGGTMLCAFFVATDPVSAATSTKGRFVYGAGIGLITYVIRRWGSYADGVAFAVILMNMAVPAIDYLTKPRIVGHDKHQQVPEP